MVLFSFPPAYGQFVPNLGQYPDPVKFSSRCRTGNVWLLERSLSLQIFDPQGSSCVVSLNFEGSDEPFIHGMGERPDRWNFYLGNDPARWRSGVPCYDEALYCGVYPDIDLRVYQDGGRPRYDFLLAPGADPSRIQIRVEGASAVCVDLTGDLVLETALGELVQSRPRVYELHDEGRVEVAGSFELLSPNTYGFSVPRIGLGSALVIDPAFTYGTYLGGTDDENHFEDFSGRVAPGPDASVFSFGGTYSADFPVTTGPPFQAVCDLFVAKLCPKGSGSADLIWSTLLGGDAKEEAWGLVVSASGEAYLTGQTLSTDFPTTPGAHLQSDATDNEEGYVANLNANGSLENSTVMEYCRGFCVYFFHDYPETAWPASSCSGETTGLFVAVSGTAFHQDFVATSEAFDTSFNGVGPAAIDAFFRIYSPDLHCLAYSTFLGGDDFDEAYDIAVSPAGIVYLVGATSSGPEDAMDPFVDGTHFPLKSGTGLAGDIFDRELGEPSPVQLGEGYVFAFDPTPGMPDPDHDDQVWERLVFSTLLGGSAAPAGGTNLEYCFTVDLDPSGNVYVSGTTPSDDFPCENPISGPIGEFGPEIGHDGFIAKFNSLGVVQFSSYFTGTDNEDGSTIELEYEWVYGIDVDPAQPDRFWIAGQTESESYATDASSVFDNTHQGALAGEFDMFVAGLRHTTGSPTLEYFAYFGGALYDTQKSLSIDAFGGLHVGGWTKSSDFPITSGAYQGSHAGGESDAAYIRLEVSDRLLRGDADHDGDVDSQDLSHLMQKLPLVCKDAGDVNDDGLNDAADIAHLSMWLNENGPPPPAPYPDCGIDLTIDTLRACYDSPVVCP